MGELQNWTEIGTGYFRFVIASSMCYEILINDYDTSKDILDASATLYVTGTYTTPNVESLFERQECMKSSVRQCLAAAVEDDAANNVYS